MSVPIGVSLSAGLAALVTYIVLDSPVLALVSCGLAGAMIAIAIVDLREFRIPDVLSLPAIPLGLLATGRLVSGDGAWIEPGHVIGSAIAGLAFWGIRESYWRLRGREGLGLGDVKLAAVAGAWTGWQGVSTVVALAACGAIAWVLLARLRDPGAEGALGRDTVVPFGVTLAPAIWLVWFAQRADWLVR
jgi:leader peptidase (prepilin peptidase)/N-methyltransferase